MKEKKIAGKLLSVAVAAGRAVKNVPKLFYSLWAKVYSVAHVNVVRLG